MHLVVTDDCERTYYTIQKCNYVLFGTVVQWGCSLEFNQTFDYISRGNKGTEINLAF